MGDPATRDTAFFFYQLNLIFAMGLIGGPLILRHASRRLSGTWGPDDADSFL